MDDTAIEDEFAAAPAANTRHPKNLIREQKISPEHLERSIEAKTRMLDIAQKNLVNIYKNEPKIAVRVAPSYAKYFGRIMRVAINGISVAVACDGRTVQLPESFAAEVMKRMSEMDRYELRQQKMADVKSNAEISPGSISFFG